MLFEPIKKRAWFSGTGLTSALSTKYEDSKPMGNYAQVELEDVLKAWLLGLHDEYSPIVPRALRWLDQAIAKDEDFGADRNLHRSNLHWAKAIGEWMLHEHTDEGSLGRARGYAEAAWRNEARPWSMNEVVKHGLDDYMAFCCQIEELEINEVGIQMFERWAGETKLSLKRTMKPRELGYAICLSRIQPERSFGPDEMFDAGRKMLQANLEENWLGGGQAIRAATWLKIVYWDRLNRGPDLTPLETMLKAYENMPKVSRPAFV